jgi:small subunit ribosomal protein S1
MPGSKVSGEIVSVKDYGIFVELSDGIEGLIHVSEMSWTNKKSANKTYNVGEKVEAVVLEVDVENKRISLGLKQLMPNPWDNLVNKYNTGKVVEGTVKAIVDFGLFVDLGEEVDALIHVSDLSWTRKNVNPAEEFKVGQKVKAAVVTVDADNQKFCLGLKQLEEDPWKRIEERMPVGSPVEGEAVRITEFGVFVELETGIEGLVHISEMSEERVEKPSDKVAKGDRVKAIVISIDKTAKKIALSMKAITSGEYKSNYKPEVAQPSTLADKLKGFKV